MGSAKHKPLVVFNIELILGRTPFFTEGAPLSACRLFAVVLIFFREDGNKSLRTININILIHESDTLSETIAVRHRL